MEFNSAFKGLIISYFCLMKLLAEGIRVQTEETELFRVAGQRVSEKEYHVDQWAVFNSFCTYGDSFVSKTGLKTVNTN